MTNRYIGLSPQVYARVAGVLYLIVIAAGIIAQLFISDRIIVSDDAAGTAANIAAHENLFRLGFTLYIIEMTSQIAMTVFLYILLKPISRSISLLALVVGLAGCVIKILSRLFYITPLFVLGGANYLSVFSADQRQALALLLLEVNDQAAGMALPFFGFSTFLNGVLIFRSTFLPRALGVLSMLGGLGWLTYLYPPLGNQFLPYILVAALLGSMAQILWLLIMGVNTQKWLEKARQTQST